MAHLRGNALWDQLRLVAVVSRKSQLFEIFMISDSRGKKSFFLKVFLSHVERECSECVHLGAFADLLHILVWQLFTAHILVPFQPDILGLTRPPESTLLLAPRREPRMTPQSTHSGHEMSVAIPLGSTVPWSEI